jgi:hypothetical protein
VLTVPRNVKIECPDEIVAVISCSIIAWRKRRARSLPHCLLPRHANCMMQPAPGLPVYWIMINPRSPPPGGGGPRRIVVGSLCSEACVRPSVRPSVPACAPRPASPRTSPHAHSTQPRPSKNTPQSWTAAVQCARRWLDHALRPGRGRTKEENREANRNIW